MPFYGNELKEECASAGIPFIQTNAPVSPSPAGRSVKVHVFGATLEVLSYLRSMGHRSITIIDSETRYGFIDERERAFRRYAADHDIEDPSPYVIHSIEAQDKYGGGYREMRELLARDIGITAALMLNDLVAVGAVAGARSLGLEVPRGISIVGFDNADIAQYANPPLTTVGIPTVKQGEIAVRMLIDLIRNPGEPGYSVQLQTQLIIRDSVRQLPVRENVC